MAIEVSPKTLQTICTAVPAYYNKTSRTPLHVDFEAGSNKVPAKEIDIYKRDGAQSVFDFEYFNAIGSRLLNGKAHKPILDVDHGAIIQNVRGSKAILGANHKGTYRPISMLRDLLGDHQIDLEVFEYPELRHVHMTGRDELNAIRVGSVVLRHKEPDVFEEMPSTTDNHSHLYIQQEFSDSDHSSLITELGALGIISEDWENLVEQEGMGIVRTPWTVKPITARSS
jgi:hypothetical protein